MRKPRTTILLLTVIVIALGYTSHLRMDGNPNSPVISGLNASATPSRARSFPSEIAAQKSVQVFPVAMQPPVTILPATVVTTGQLSTDANALVAEMCDLHLLACDTDLSLSSQEWSAFAAVVLRIQAIRQGYEAQIATSQVMAPGRYRLEIPAYAGVGDALREKFHADLRAGLGELKAAEVLAKLGARLEGRFAGFGVSVQTLDVTASPGGALSDLEVTRTATYWDSVEGSDRLTTRREVHFPVLEDPTGDSWSALLAMVKA